MSAEIPFTPVLLIANANAFVELGAGFGPKLRSKQGRLVEVFLREMVGARTPDEQEADETDPALAPWDAAFVRHVGYWSHFDQRCGRSSWPLPATNSVTELAQYAFTTGLIREAPLAGDVFLAWDAEVNQFTRTGIVVQVELFGRSSSGTGYFRCATIEGSSERLHRESGRLSLRHTRNLCPALGDRVIRWTALDPREERRELIEMEIDRMAQSAAA